MFLFFICGRLCVFQTIIFIRDRNSRRQEVSAYIDYAHRLATDDFEAYFSGKKRLFPRNTDLRYLSLLSFYLSALRQCIEEGLNAFEKEHSL